MLAIISRTHTGYTNIICDIIADAVGLLKRYDMINGTHSGVALIILCYPTKKKVKSPVSKTKSYYSPTKFNWPWNLDFK